MGIWGPPLFTYDAQYDTCSERPRARPSTPIFAYRMGHSERLAYVRKVAIAKTCSPRYTLTDSLTHSLTRRPPCWVSAVVLVVL